MAGPSKKLGKMLLLQASTNLPANLSRDIGRIIIHWAHFEFLVQRVIWLLAGVDEKVGRVAVKDPRITDRLDMIVTLSELQGIKIDAALISKMKTAAEAMLSYRDLLAHGVWGKDDDGWKVQKTKGNYPKDIKTVSRSRRVAPEGVLATSPDLQEIVRNIERLCTAIQLMRKDLKVKLEALSQKHL